LVCALGVRRSKLARGETEEEDCGVKHLALATVRGRELVKALAVLAAASQHSADSAQQLVEVAQEVDELGGIVGNWNGWRMCPLISQLA